MYYLILMDWIAQHKEILVAIAAVSGMVLGIINLFRSVSENRFKIKVYFDNDPIHDTLVIAVLNESKFDITLSEVGTLTSEGKYLIPNLNISDNTEVLPYRLISRSRRLFRLESIQVVRHTLGCRAYAKTAGGKEFTSAHSHPQTILQRFLNWIKF